VEVTNVRRLGNGLGNRVEQLARWWTSASQEERFLLLRQTIDARSTQKEISLDELKLAIYLSEAEAGEIGEG
jgi:hypothetical protein